MHTSDPIVCKNTQYVHTPHTHTCSRVLTHAHTHAYRNSGSNTKCPSGTTSTCEIQTIEATDTASDQYGSTVGAAVVWNTADFPAGITDPGPTYVLFVSIRSGNALPCVASRLLCFPTDIKPVGLVDTLRASTAFQFVFQRSHTTTFGPPV